MTVEDELEQMAVLLPHNREMYIKAIDEIHRLKKLMSGWNGRAWKDGQIYDVQTYFDEKMNES